MDTPAWWNMGHRPVKFVDGVFPMDCAARRHASSTRPRSAPRRVGSSGWPTTAPT
jgi:hypothetical protein